MCSTMEVSRAGFYSWLGRGDSKRAREDQRLRLLIREVHAQSRGTYGAPRIHAALKKRGEICGLHRVERLMREAGIHSKLRRKFKQTPNSHHCHPVAQNTLDQKFDPAGSYVVCQCVPSRCRSAPGLRFDLLQEVEGQLLHELEGRAQLTNEDPELRLVLRGPKRGRVGLVLAVHCEPLVVGRHRITAQVKDRVRERSEHVPAGVPRAMSELLIQRVQVMVRDRRYTLKLAVAG